VACDCSMVDRVNCGDTSPGVCRTRSSCNSTVSSLTHSCWPPLSRPRSQARHQRRLLAPQIKEQDAPAFGLPHPARSCEGLRAPLCSLVTARGHQRAPHAHNWAAASSKLAARPVLRTMTAGSHGGCITPQRDRWCTLKASATQEARLTTVVY